MAILTLSRAKDLLDRIRSVETVVVGDLMLDRYISGAVDRVSPEAPVPIVRVEGQQETVGGAGNVAANISAIGAMCSVVGCVGDDAEGRIVYSALQRQGVDVSGVVKTPGRPTTVKTRVIAGHQQMVRFDLEDDSELDVEVAGQLIKGIKSSATDTDVIVIEDYNKGVLSHSVIDAAMRASAEHGIPSVVDPKQRNFFSFSGATVFKPNAKELGDALGACIYPDDPLWMKQTREHLSCACLLVTLGSEGIALDVEGAGHRRLFGASKMVYDVSGAGDTVTAVLATVMAAGGSPVEAADIANHAAAVGVTKAGVATVSPEEILEQIEAKVPTNPTENK